MMKLPRIRLGNYPTPLHELPNLSAVLGGPRILVKREDVSGLIGIGGNKIRRLEFLIANAKQNGVDTIITTAGSQSNWCLAVAAAVRKLNMEAVFIVFEGVHNETQGNLLLQNILNSDVRISSEKSLAARSQTMDEIADKLRKEGRNPLIMSIGTVSPSTSLGIAGWVNAAQEIQQQLKNQKINAQYLLLAMGSGGTQAGLVLGVKHLGLTLKVIGISVGTDKANAINTVVAHANETAQLLELETSVSPDEVIVYDEYVGEGYGVITGGCVEAIRLVAQTEGIFLDPVYTGKAMAALIDLTRKGEVTSKDTVVFIHTGGLPALFAYNNELT